MSVMNSSMPSLCPDETALLTYQPMCQYAFTPVANAGETTVLTAIVMSGPVGHAWWIGRSRVPVHPP